MLGAVIGPVQCTALSADCCLRRAASSASMAKQNAVTLSVTALLCRNVSDTHTLSHLAEGSGFRS